MSATFAAAPLRFDDAPEASQQDPDDLYWHGYWEREAEKMQSIADFHASEGRFGKAEYCRQFITSFRRRADMLRRTAA